MNLSVIFMFLVRKRMVAAIRYFPIPGLVIPRKTKYSPFCGIAGYRLFPRDKSMEPDSIGTKDLMAVVVSKDSLNWAALNEKLSQNKSGDYASRLRSALGSTSSLIQADVSQKGNIHFKGDGVNSRLVACIVEINK